MGALPEHLVVQVHPQAAGGIAEHPDLGVLALRPFGMCAVLRFQPLGDAVHVPVECLVVVAGHLGQHFGRLLIAGQSNLGADADYPSDVPMTGRTAAMC